MDEKWREIYVKTVYDAFNGKVSGSDSVSPRPSDIDEELRRAREVLFKYAEPLELCGDKPAEPKTDLEAIGVAKIALAMMGSELLKQELSKLLAYIDTNNSNKESRLILYESLDRVLIYSAIVNMFARRPLLSDLEASFRMARPRAARSGRAAERRSRMRPFVDQARAEYPDASPTRIAGIIRWKSGTLFPETRRTIEADVQAIMNPEETGEDDDEFEDEIDLGRDADDGFWQD